MAGNIAKRENGMWRARYRDAGGREHARHFGRKLDAQRWLDGVSASVNAGTYLDPDRSRVTVGEICVQWRAGKVNLKPTTRVRYDGVLTAHVLPRWGSTPLVRVEHGAVQMWVAQLSASGLAGASVRKVHGVFSGVLGLAVKDRRLAINPAVGVDLPPLNEGRRRYLSADQVEDLADAADGGRLAVLVLAYCGLRWSELAALRVSSFDLVRGRLQVTQAVTEVNGGRLAWGTPKSHERRSVPVPRFLAEELGRSFAGRDADSLAFPAPVGGVLRNRNARRSWFDPAARAIGEPALTPHELRHTAASLAVSAGANIKAVQRMLGHKSAAMTLDRYADLFDADLDDVASRLDGLARSVQRARADSVRTGGNFGPMAEAAGTAVAQ